MAREAKHKMVSVFLEMETFRALEELAKAADATVEETIERLLFHIIDDERQLKEQAA